METFENVKCRLCLKISDKMENLFATDSKYKFIIEDFIGLKIEYSLRLPSMICDICINMIKKILEFKETCIKSQHILQNQEESVINNIKVDTDMLNIKIENPTIDESITEVKITCDDEFNEYKLEENTMNKNDQPVTTKVRSDENKQKSKKRKTKTLLKNSGKDNSKIKKEGNTIEKVPTRPTWKQTEEKYKVSCYICGRMLNKFIMEHHLNRHLGRTPFECKVEDCKKAFPSPRELRQHIQYHHSNEKPHKCDICGQCYRNTSQMKLHRTTHFEPTVPCNLCGKLFKNRNLLHKHNVKHYGQRKHKCDDCSFSSSRKWSLKVHFKKIHKKEAINCYSCGMLFANNTNLEIHVTNSHPGNKQDVIQKEQNNLKIINQNNIERSENK